MKLFLSISFLFCLSFANAKDHYASSAAEANKLLNEAKPGDRVIMKDGTYTDAAINFNIKATKDQTFIFTAEHAGKVFFEGNSTLSFGGSYVTVEGFTWKNGGKDLNTKSVIEIKGEYNTLSNCAIIGYNISDNATDNKWVAVFGKYNTVTHCLLKDKFNLGATLTVWLKDGEEAHHTISYNYFLNRQNGPNESNGLESIRIGDSKTSFTNAHCVVAFNRFEDCDGEIEIISNKSCYNSYLHNTFYNSNGGLTLRHGNNCLVDGNVFDGGSKERSYGVRIIGEGHVVTNNYFFNLKGGQKELMRAPLTVVNGLINTPINGYFQVRRAVIANNIFANNVLPDIRLGATSKREGMIVVPDTVLIRANLFYDDDGNKGEVYEDLMESKHVTIDSNIVAGNSMTVPKKGFEKLGNGKRDGFDWIKDKKGNILASVDQKTKSSNADAGASWVDPAIKTKTDKSRYTLTSKSEVGPNWMK